MFEFFNDVIEEVNVDIFWESVEFVVWRVLNSFWRELYLFFNEINSSLLLLLLFEDKFLISLFNFSISVESCWLVSFKLMFLLFKSEIVFFNSFIFLLFSISLLIKSMLLLIFSLLFFVSFSTSKFSFKSFNLLFSSFKWLISKFKFSMSLFNL